MKPAVELSDVTHVYVNDKGAFLAVEGIGFTIEAGQIVSLIGPSGCGKTTVLSMIAGLIKPTEGKIEVGGEQVTGPSRKIGYMLQQDYLFPWRTILDNATIGLELNGLLNEQSKAETERLLDEMGLAGTGNRYPHQLSGGMRQRAAFVRTLATSPELLLLDEPFSALDYQTKLKLEQFVANTLKSKNKTALLVTHDISEAIAMSDRIIMMDRNPGRIRKQFAVPEPVRRADPLKARELPEFHRLFNMIWSEFEVLESAGGMHYETGH
jgi:NitT/TauT family transport system ATP-binding protein